MTTRLGFSTGPLRKSGMHINDRISFFSALGATAIELGYVVESRLLSEPLADINVDLLENFSWVSLHGPGSEFKYGDNDKTRNVLDEIETLHKRKKLDLVVFHPDSFDNFSILDDYTFPVGIENMDEKKILFQTEDSLIPIFKENNNFKFVLDINHCYVNDKSLSLVKTLYNKLEGYLAEFHISGFKTLHDPLFETKQDNFLEIVDFGKLPVIVESMLSSKDQVKKEYEYIMSKLEGK